MKNGNENNMQDSGSIKLVLGIVSIWFLLAFIGGTKGIFYQPNEPPLYVGLFVLVPILGFTFAYAVSMRMRRTVNRIPLWLITIAHAWRFVGLGFVVGAIINVVPPQFGYPEGLGDVITAVFCIPLAFAIRKKSLWPRLRTAFPVNLIPTFFVPLFILLHLLALSKNRELAIATD